MLPSLRQRSHLLLNRTAFRACRSYADKASPAKSNENHNTAATDVVASSSIGSTDEALAESIDKSEAITNMQAPNRKGIWSRSQQPRHLAMSGPRFEQTKMEDQVRLELSLDSECRNWLTNGF